MDYTYSFHNLAIATVHSTAAEANEPDCWVCTKSPSSTRNQLSWVSVPLNSQWYEDRHLRYDFSPKKVSIRPFRQEGFVTSLKGDLWVCLESKPIDKLTDSAAAGYWKCQQSLEMNTMDGDGQFTLRTIQMKRGVLCLQHSTDQFLGLKAIGLPPQILPKPYYIPHPLNVEGSFSRSPYIKPILISHHTVEVFSWMEFLRPCRLLRQCGHLQID